MKLFTPAEAAAHHNLQRVEAAEDIEHAVVGCEISLFEVGIVLHEVRLAQIHYRQAHLQLVRQTAQINSPIR